MSNSIPTTEIINGRTLVMGILNVTPDSFSDGGQWIDLDRAVEHVFEMIGDGADIIDIGAESTRPNFNPISVDEELNRLEPILRALNGRCPIPISVDTYKPSTAQAAVELGADMINAVHCDRSMLETAARLNVPLVVTHDRTSVDVIADVNNFFEQTVELADEIGLPRDNLIFDPGIGFGKTQEQNLTILRRLDEIKTDRPLMLGVSRKSLIEYALGLPIDQRDEVTGAWCVVGAMRGADIVRVHNVKMIAKMLRAVDVVNKKASR
ncbi:MAG: dihydropteroate synthase [Selenomonadaceae bacterium]|nr:dihydropteroate synthase [Selenomonadaceae bacterium]